MSKNTVKAIPVEIILASTFDDTLLPMNAPGGLPKACFSLHVLNDSDQDIIVSFDGVTNQIIILANTERELSFQNFSRPNNQVALMAKGTIIYVRAPVGTGAVTVSGFYQQEN